MAEIDLAFLARKLDEVLTGQHTAREDMTVMMEILRRVDHRIGSLEMVIQSIGAQLTDMHVYNRRVEARVHTLEER